MQNQGQPQQQNPPFQILKQQPPQPQQQVVAPQPVREYAYLVISPDPASTMHLKDTNLQGQPRRFWIKIGDHTRWDESKDAYNRATPSYWYRSIECVVLQVNIGRCGIQISNNVFGFAPQNVVPGYTRIQGNEWYVTDKLNEVLQLVANWDNHWQPGNQPVQQPAGQPNIYNGLPVGVQRVQNGTVGPSFPGGRNDAMTYFRSVLR
ncbi:hypothetical protein K432DRAFT_381987 [Lepidopterella palustris CBS 459.81]|uniref:Uncharacterized protein n=1 Tax=Lepidopterella palustris CBS 459.81 TaxID=1314670 RepID=A0A8E2EAV6_9PEZI|nr:hypothetical protein K432DRAFT_381987 [Lepidopterella palustris CBS 459.81]